MKKLLSILSSFLIVSSTILTVVACENMISLPDPEKPDPEKPDPEKPDPEKPDPEKPDPEKPDPELPIVRTIDHEEYKVFGETYEEWQEISEAYSNAKDEMENIYKPIGDPPKNPSLEYYDQQQAGVHFHWYNWVWKDSLIYIYLYENDLDVDLYENNKFDLVNFSKQDLQHIYDILFPNYLMPLMKITGLINNELGDLFAEYGDENDEYNYNERFLNNYINPFQISYYDKLTIIEKILR
ncbi:lipoprotein [Spiroplasma endosymbiont of Anurida maritima]|uniref:lipoprotein n=1 Tax=Spiroplasma endosymbiont of Anurida maritima TaxID=2967972 RepID=UPI0036D3E8EB